MYQSSGYLRRQNLTKPRFRDPATLLAGRWLIAERPRRSHRSGGRTGRDHARHTSDPMTFGLEGNMVSVEGQRLNGAIVPTTYRMFFWSWRT